MRKEWTIKEINLLKELAAQGKDRFEIAEIMGIDYTVIRNKTYQLKLDVKKHSKFKGKVYAVYKKDQYITSGTVEELAMYLGVKRETITFYTSNVHLKRTSENAIRLVEI